MRKFLLYLLIAVGLLGIVSYLYKGRVPDGRFGVLVSYKGGVAEAEPVSGLVFSLSRGRLFTYPITPYYFRMVDTDMVKVRTMDGVDVGLELGLGLQFDAPGAERYSTMFDRPVEEVVGQELRSRIGLNASAVVATLTLGTLSARLDSVCALVMEGSKADAGRIGLRITTLEVLAPPVLPERVQQLLQAAFATDREMHLAEHYFNTAVLMEEAARARSRSKLDSATTHDSVSRMDSTRLYDQSIQRFRTDSTLFALKYTRGFLENKRLEVIAKAVEKWDGRLAGSSFDSPFNELGRGTAAKTEALDKVP